MTISNHELADRYVHALKALELTWPETERVVRATYAPSFEFEDPLYRVRGIEAYVRLMERMNQGAKKIRVDVHHAASRGDEALVRLTLTYSFRFGGSMRLPACSSAVFRDGHVVRRIDFWDTKDALRGLSFRSRTS